ncbi:MAG TPA: hypothetical protein VM030_10480 [Acidimicrobiales bacterium]|nr:hypothetical protein [Acidimicrobiales bacterium]
MLLAELEVRHTRAVVPTRRIALGDLWLPTDPAPGPGGLLLAAIVGAIVPRLDDETRDDLEVLIDDLDHHRRIAQPRLRYRFQTDVVGLDKSRHKLVRVGRAFGLEIDDHGNLLPQALGAVYAASHLSLRARTQVFRLVRRATRWEGGADDGLLAFLSAGDASSMGSRRGRGDEGWALTVLGFSTGTEPARSEILGRFRQLVRDAHPDHGGEAEHAGDRINDLAEAKRILLL